jgi:hypothetical protein
MALFPLGILSAAGADFGAYELISTTVLAGTATSITFSNLGDYSNTYRHLQVRIVARSNRSGQATSGLAYRLNGDTGNNYATHGLFGNGTSVGSFASISAPDAGLTGPPAATATSNVFGSNILDLLDVFSTTKNKTGRTLGERPLSIELTSNHWRNTALVTSLTVYDQLASLIAGSRVSLYGIRG